MPERNSIERLNDAVDALLSASGPLDALEGTPLGGLLATAGDLCHLPSAGFRARLHEELVAAARGLHDTQRKEELAMTSTTAIRPGFHTVNLYLQVSGAAKLIDFLRDAFGAKETYRMPLPDGTIRHAEIQIGDSVLELADAGGEWPAFHPGIHLYVPNVDEVYRQAVAAGANALQEPTDQSYGDREAGIKDPSGNVWYIATHRLIPGRFAPEGLYAITPFLNPEGAQALIDFMRHVVNAEVVSRHDTPDGKIGHATVRIGDSIIEVNDAHEPYHPRPAALHLYIEDVDEAYDRALAAGARALFPPEDKPYGERSGGFVDQFGNNWYLARYLGEDPK